MFELHEFEVSGDQVESANVGLAYHVRDWNRIVVTDCIVKRPTVHEVKLRLNAVKSRKGSLRVQIDRKNPISLESKPLCEMS
mgnify:CR=1 FL=1